MKRLTLIDKAFLLKRTPIFNTLDLDLLLTIADKLGAVIFDAGDFVFIANEEANRMYFVIRGQVEIQSMSNQIIDRLGEGDFFGEESLFNNKPRAYAAFTPIETYVLTLSRTNLYTIISECPSVAVGFLQVYTSVVDYRAIKPLEKNL
jgi:CRP/FNR family transcriptional regulator, cyclic AMP receptor protein